MRVIKRYSNRRLYDTVASRTLTLIELAALVRAGTRVRVIDAGSGQDVTVEVLGRTLVTELSASQDDTRSRELLYRTIMKSGERSMSILKNTVLASIGAFQVTKAKAEKIIDELIKKGELNKSDRKKAVMELLDKAEKSTTQWREKVSKEAGRVQKEVTSAVKKINVAKSSDLKKLEAKVDRLNASIKRLQDKLDKLG
jgi:polyhydroxyalkanoate synthesis repressor PhaR